MAQQHARLHALTLSAEVNVDTWQADYMSSSVKDSARRQGLQEMPLLLAMPLAMFAR